VQKKEEGGLEAVCAARLKPESPRPGETLAYF